MGTGASNQVRSKLDGTNETAISSPLKPTANKNIFLTRTENFAKSHSETIANQSLKPLKSQHTSQKAEIRSLHSPSYHSRKTSQDETEDVSTNLSKRELHQKIRELELALAASESQKLDLQDQLQELEGTIHETTAQSLPVLTNTASTLHETLKVKDQRIEKLEEDLYSAQTEFQKRTLKFKKRIRGLTKQIFELRQEALITKMEQKTILAQQNDPTENHSLNTTASNEDKGISPLVPLPNASHTKIIVDLSSHISEQEEQIARLTAEVVERDQKIEKLEAALTEARKTESTVPTSLHYEALNTNAIASSDKALSSKGGKHESAFNTMQLSSIDHIRNETSTYKKSNNSSLRSAHQKPAFKIHSTTLSDSDSDWEEGPSLPQVHRHSAPAHSRGKSNLS